MIGYLRIRFDASQRCTFFLSVETGPAPDSSRILTPVINGVPLTKLVAAFEASRGFEPAGAYDGILPDHFNYGPLERYFRGDTDDRFWAPGVWVLACHCTVMPPCKAVAMQNSDLPRMCGVGRL